MTLTTVALNALKPQDKPYKRADGFGLYIQVMPNGSKLWRYKYRLHGEEKRLSMGRFPDISIGEARKRRVDARAILDAGRDPAIERQKEKLVAALSLKTTFDAVAREYIEHKMIGEGRADVTVRKAYYLLDKLMPIKGLPLAQIGPPELLAALRRIEGSGRFEVAKRCLSFAGRIFRYGVQTGRATSDPAAGLRGALRNPKVKHHAAIHKPEKVGELLRAIDHYDGHASTRFALKIAPHVMARPGELRMADWQEFDLDKAEWKIPAERMKMRKPHIVPLSRQVVIYLQELSQVTGPAGYVFPAFHTSRRPMSENTMNQALRRLGYTKDEMTSHGWRSTASTLLNESREWSADAIEQSLAHNDTNAIRGSYNRAGYWDERVRMHQWWSDYLDRLRSEGSKDLEQQSSDGETNVIQFASRRAASRA